MSNYLNRVNPMPPSYSGVTINITNPALNIPAGNSYMYGSERNSIGANEVLDVYRNPSPSYQYQVSQQSNSANFYNPQREGGIYQITQGNSYLPTPQYNYQTIPQGVNPGVNYLPAPQYNYQVLPQGEKQGVVYLPSPQYVYPMMPKEHPVQPELKNNEQYLQPVNNINQEVIVPKQASESNTISAKEAESKSNETVYCTEQVQESADKHVAPNNNTYPQNINMTNIYQTAPSDTQKLPNVYPQEYYINNFEKLPGNSADDTQNATKQTLSEPVIDATEKEEQVNTDTSKEIITELDRRHAEQKNIEKNRKTTKIVSLTNEYIMSLENYLNNPNTDIRLMAAKEILTRLDEDKNRYDDAALNALLNKMLQDPNKLVRIAAFSALTSELASGNDYTVQLLKQIQQNPQADPEDVLEASQILLKRTTATEIRYVPVYNQQPQEVNKQ